MTGLELIVAAVATLFSGQPATIECLPAPQMNERRQQAGLREDAHAWALNGTITLYKGSCQDIAWIVRNPARANEPAFASVELLVLGHEVAHTLGNHDERGATCWGLGSMARVAKALGVRPRTARIMRNEAREAMRAAPDYYC